MHWLPDLTFLDIETTGTTPSVDRITEVALIKIEDGEQSVVWQSLINPQENIPRHIGQLTGITNEMINDAPSFKDFGGDLYSFLVGTVLVAHNGRFDYGFLKAEYTRLEGTLRLRTLCTVKLSKRLYPDVSGHSLDAIMKRFGLRTNARHRAMGDTQLMLDFLEAAKRDLGSVRVLEAINAQLKGPTLPPGIDDSFIKEIQDVPGVYLFYDDTNLPLYIGKSTKLRSRVLNHFSSDHVTATEMELSQKIKRVEWLETAGELGALLLEARLIKSKQPTYNRLLRKHKKLYSIQMSQQMNVVPWLKIVTLDEVDPTELEFLYGIFKTKKSAKELIYKLVDEHKLCCKVLGLEKGKGKCFGEHVGKCSGVCVGKEKHELHHLRLKTSLIAHKLRAWPYDGKVGIKEFNPDTKNIEVHIFEQWCYLDTVDSDMDLSETINSRYNLQFDLDIYRLIGKAIDSASNILLFTRIQPA